MPANHPIPPLVRIVETCAGAPSQWDAWDANGQYYYLRYRHSAGRVEKHDSPDVQNWDVSNYPDGCTVASFEDPREEGDAVGNPSIGLDEFLDKAQLTKADGCEVTPWRFPDDDDADEVMASRHAEVLAPSGAGKVPADELLAKGRFSVYSTKDGGYHLAYLVDGADEDDVRHIHIPGMHVKMLARMGAASPFGRMLRMR